MTRGVAVWPLEGIARTADRRQQGLLVRQEMVELLRQLVGIHRRTENLLPKTGPKVAEKDVVAMAFGIRVSGGVVRAKGAKPGMGEVDIGLRAGKEMPSGVCTQLLRGAATACRRSDRP